MQWIKAFLLTSVIAVICFIGGCKKSKTGTLQLQLNPVYGNQNFALYSCNTDPTGKNVKLETFQFYLSHMYLVGTNNTQVKVTDISFFDLSNPSTLTLSVPDIEGTFSGITFYCGVDSVMDTISPLSTTGPPGLEAGAPSLYWFMLQYQFESISGLWDTACIPVMANALVYHVGGYPYLYKPVNLSSSFSVCCGSTVTKTINLDVEKIFYTGNTETLNIVTQNSTMCDTVAATGGRPDALIIAQQFVTNFAGAFSLQ